MKIALREYHDRWQYIKNATLNTISLNKGSYPTSEYKRKLLLSEHSPIRKLTIGWRWEGIKSWVSVHFCRHKLGVEHFISTRRTDRTGVDRNALRQDEAVNHECEANAQSIIFISRKRLCSCASVETREAWKLFLNDIVKDKEPELYSVCVPECVYRGGLCPEFETCGYVDSEKFKGDLKEYWKNTHARKEWNK